MQRNDSVNCDSCGGMFDPHNSPCEWVETKYQQFLICGTCYHGYTEDELSERLE
jgi:hypothetical protein